MIGIVTFVTMSVAFTAFTTAATAPTLFSNILVSGYNSEMVLYNLTTERFSVARRWEVAANLTWLQQHTKTGDIYTIHEVSEYMGETGGAVSRWQFVNGTLVMREYLSTRSVGPAHLLLDEEHNLVFTANYGGGTLTVFNTDNQGKLLSLVQTEEYGVGCMRTSHPHETVRHGDLVWIMDLGCDAVWHYRIMGGRLQKLGNTSVEHGAGPRHMLLHPTRNLAFLACELKSLLELYSVDYRTGNLTLIQQLSLSSIRNNTGAEVLLGEDERTLYISSRGVGEVLVYHLQDSSSQGTRLVKLQEFHLAGTWPRSIARSGNTLLAADQMGNTLEHVNINKTTGLLEKTNITTPTPKGPSFVTFINKM